ncbi:MAG: hypothetical protein AAFX06_02930 [Planctomycetota bacterium]
MIVQRNRQGTIMIGVLACLAVVSVLLGLLVRDALAARRETKLRHQWLQTSRLLDAGVLRATTQKTRDPEYDGETWSPDLRSSSESVPASVKISVDGDQIKVTATIGHAPDLTTQSHQYSFGQ